MERACVIEVMYIDPDAYVNVVNHNLRKEIVKALYRKTLHSPISKKELADAIGIDYHQLVYQLNNQLNEFWKVAHEKKVRGTRIEFIEPLSKNAIFITLGKENTIHLIDPLAGLFGSLKKVGVRCDSCSEEEVGNCLEHLKKASLTFQITQPEKSVLATNQRLPPLKPLDYAIIRSLRGISKGEKSVITIPCERCSFIKRIVKINGV
ncbi:MAG: hypothetical protein QXN93_03245 [Methanomassiliicoccales archaeon]